MAPRPRRAPCYDAARQAVVEHVAFSQSAHRDCLAVPAPGLFAAGAARFLRGRSLPAPAPKAVSVPAAVR